MRSVLGRFCGLLALAVISNYLACVDGDVNIYITLIDSCSSSEFSVSVVFI